MGKYNFVKTSFIKELEELVEKTKEELYEKQDLIFKLKLSNDTLEIKNEIYLRKLDKNLKASKQRIRVFFDRSLDEIIISQEKLDRIEEILGQGAKVQGPSMPVQNPPIFIPEYNFWYSKTQEKKEGYGVVKINGKRMLFTSYTVGFSPNEKYKDFKFVGCTNSNDIVKENLFEGCF